MKTALDNALTWLTSTVAAMAVSATGQLDNLSGGIPDHATLWFLVALAMCLGAGLFVLYVISWHRVEDVLEYRTANYSAIEVQTRALQAKVPSARRRSHYLKPCTAPHASPRSDTSEPLPWREDFDSTYRNNVVAFGAALHKNLAQIRVQAAAAALRDMGHGTYTRNRYAPGTPEHAAWADAHGQVYQVKPAQQAPAQAQPEA